MAVTALRRPDAAELARDRVERAAGLLNAANAELAATTADLLDTGAWEGSGIHGPEHWLQWRAGLTGAEARRVVRIAKALPSLPRNAELFAAGQLSVGQMDVVAGTSPAASRAATRPGGCTSTTSSTGGTVVPPRWPTSCPSAAATAASTTGASSV